MSPTASRPDLSGITVLVIDDHPESIQLLIAALEPFGPRLVTARSAHQAKGVLTALVPDILICDLALPDGDGLDLIRWLRASALAYGRTVPAIAVTAFYERFGVRDAVAAGFNMFLRKPIDPMDIVHAVAVLARRQPS